MAQSRASEAVKSGETRQGVQREQTDVKARNAQGAELKVKRRDRAIMSIGSLGEINQTMSASPLKRRTRSP